MITDREKLAEKMLNKAIAALDGDDVQGAISLSAEYRALVAEKDTTDGVFADRALLAPGPDARRESPEPDCPAAPVIEPIPESAQQ